MNDNDKPKVLPFKRKLTPAEAEAEAHKIREMNAEAIALKKLGELQKAEEEGESCSATIKLIEMMLEAAKKGEISGIATIAWDPTAKNFRRYYNVSRQSTFTHTYDSFALMQIGALTLLRHDLEEIAFFKERAAVMTDIVENMNDEGNGG